MTKNAEKALALWRNGESPSKYAHQLAWTNDYLYAFVRVQINTREREKRYRLFNIQDVTLIIHQV